MAVSKEIKITDLVDKVQSYYPAADVELIRKAYDFSAKVHQGQKRLSGEPYLIHPMAVAGGHCRLEDGRAQRHRWFTA